MEKYCRAGQATDGDTAHAHCTFEPSVYEYGLTICNTHCFSTATIVARTRLKVTLYVRCCLVSSLPLLAKEVTYMTFALSTIKVEYCYHGRRMNYCTAFKLLLDLQLATYMKV